MNRTNLLALMAKMGNKVGDPELLTSQKFNIQKQNFEASNGKSIPKNMRVDTKFNKTGREIEEI